MNCLKVCVIVTIFVMGNYSDCMEAHVLERLELIQQRIYHQASVIMKLQAQHIETQEEEIANLERALHECRSENDAIRQNLNILEEQTLEEIMKEIQEGYDI